MVQRFVSVRVPFIFLHLSSSSVRFFENSGFQFGSGSVLFLSLHAVLYTCTAQGRVANLRPVARFQTGRVAQPITDAADATGRERSWDETRSSLGI